MKRVGTEAAMSDGYDLLIVGGGSAAFAAAIRATNLGAKVGIVERGILGGTCVNVGCIPSKHLLAAAEAYREAAHHSFPGILTAQEGVDLGALVGMKADVVATLRKEKYEDLAERYGFDLIRGHARFVSPDAVEVDGHRTTGAHVLIATGSAPWVPPIEGLEEAGYLTSTTAMELDKLPETLVVVGGNYVGLEMAQLFANLGTKVTILEALPRIAPLEEPEISRWMTRILADEGIEVAASANVLRVEAGKPKAVIARLDGDERRLETEQVLMATGRRPELAGLGLAAAGIELTEQGLLVLDEELRTTNPRIFGAGDVTGAPQFVYVAAAEARRAGVEVEARTLEFDHVPRARVTLETRGAVKIVADRKDRRVLGVHMLAPGAGDVLLAAVYAVKFGLTVADLADTWAPYLTMAEGIKLTAQAFTADVEGLSCCAA